MIITNKGLKGKLYFALKIFVTLVLMSMVLMIFVNAVLRGYLRGKDALKWPDKRKNPVDYCRVTYSFPDWIIQRFLKQYGMEKTEELLKYFNEPAPLWIRTNTLKITRSELMEKLKEKNIQLSPSTHTLEGIRIDSSVNLHQLEEFQQGYFTVQDESSMLVALAAEPGKNQRVLDVCSAPGGKATHMAQLMKDTGKIIACDVHAHRLDLIQENCTRLGITNVSPVKQDGTQMADRWKEPFDVVVCDVPCSGLGVLGRRGDARWSKESEDIRNLCGIQRRILEQAATLVKPGGTLIYSTCTMAPEENQLMVEAFTKAHPEYALDETLPDCWLNIEKGQEGYVQFLPFEDHMDGFFIARLMRREEEVL